MANIMQWWELSKGFCPKCGSKIFEDLRRKRVRCRSFACDFDISSAAAVHVVETTKKEKEDVYKS